VPSDGERSREYEYEFDQKPSQARDVVERRQTSGSCEVVSEVRNSGGRKRRARHHHQSSLEPDRGSRQHHCQAELGGGVVAHEVLVVVAQDRHPVVSRAWKAGEEAVRRE
jgi:hypothetical protein